MKTRGLAEGARVNVFNPESGDMQHADTVDCYHFQGGLKASLE